MIRYVVWLAVFMAAYAGSEYVFGMPAVGVGLVFGVLLAESERQRRLNNKGCQHD